MFGSFFYLLRGRGLDISMEEWLTLMKALELGLHGATMKGFYHLCLAVLCKSESDYDRFQQAFLEYFKDRKFYTDSGEVRAEITDEMLDWLNHPNSVIRQRFTREDVTAEQLGLSREEIEEMLAQRLREQRGKHDGGNYWVGTRGISAFGNNGMNPRGIRVGGAGKNGTAIRVAGKRVFRDFRDDNVLDIRQFQMAVRTLRSYSAQNGAEEEFDVDRTIHDTCDKAGILQIRYRKPRRNQIKVLMLMDSGGSMARHSRLCSQLFQAASNSNRFKDLKIYYFHNCPHQHLYTHPALEEKYQKYTVDVLRQCGKDYRVILVGDAAMDPNDLTAAPQFGATRYNMGLTGKGWLDYLVARYKHIVWLNPSKPADGSSYFNGAMYSYEVIQELFPMYRLSVAGLEQAMKKLMVKD